VISSYELIPYQRCMSELVFEVVQESHGGYCAECLTESIGDAFDEAAIRAMRVTHQRRRYRLCHSSATGYAMRVKGLLCGLDTSAAAHSRKCAPLDLRLVQRLYGNGTVAANRRSEQSIVG
jgi:hypothetical protein